MFRLLRKLVKYSVLLVVVYLGFNLFQVWQASRRDEARSADAIVVFGAAQYNGRPSAVLRARLDHAADLYDRDLAPMIFVTGGSQPGDETSEASASADYLREERGIDDDDITRENRGTNSWQSMAEAAKVLKEDGKVRVILVTDPFHAARVDAIAEELGLDSSVSPTRTSPIKGTQELRHIGRETVAVSAGRIVGFRRLMRIDGVATKVREGVESS